MPTIVKRPNGKFQIKPNDSDRKKGVSKETFDTEADAKARLAEIRRQLASGTVRPDESKTTVAQAARQWLATKIAIGEIRPATRQQYEICVRLHIAGTPLGDRPMSQVTYEDDVVPWLESQRKRSKDVSNLVTILRGIFQSWIDAGKPLAPGGNPVRKRVVKSQPKQVPLLTDEQVDRWRECLIPDLRAMFDVERWYGSRTGEVRGLREEDISWSGPRDPEAPLARELARLADLPADKYKERNVTLRFERQLDQRNGNQPGPTKNTRARRTMALPQHLARSLVDHWATWPPVDGWIFVCYQRPGVNRRRGDPRLESERAALIAQAQHLRAQGMIYSEIAQRLDMKRSTVSKDVRKGRPERSLQWKPRPWLYDRVRRYLKAAADAAGLDLPEGRATHVLRHHRVSMLGDQGFDSHQIGLWIGDTAQMVDLIYRHPMPDTLARMQKAMEARLAPKPDHQPAEVERIRARDFEKPEGGA